jgi:transcriptional regulator with XRE-family HTH domain
MPSRLRQKREDAGITMTELAARVNMDLSKLSRLENGHLQLKSTDLVALAIALGCKVEDLLPIPEKEEPARVS